MQGTAFRKARGSIAEEGAELLAQSCNGKMEVTTRRTTVQHTHDTNPAQSERDATATSVYACTHPARIHPRIYPRMERRKRDATSLTSAHVVRALVLDQPRTHDMHTTPNSFRVTARWPCAAVTVGHASASRNYHQPTRTRHVLAREQTQRAREPASTANLCAGAVWPHAHRRALTVRSAPPTTSMTTSMASPSSSPTSAGCAHESGQAQAARPSKTS
jgi:hypothetical protein